MIISKQTARRYVLGRQGLWPGRRWQGQAGVQAALNTAEAVQVDTISVVARNHNLVLASRVIDYREDWLNALLYTERQFFEYGGILFIYPLAEWPYRKALMERPSPWRERVRREMPDVIELVRERVRAEGPLGSRDFKGRAFVPGGFNVMKDANHGLQYLWISGELLIHSRRGFDRVYELTERLLPATLASPGSITLAETEAFFIAKAVRDLGLGSLAEISRRFVGMLRRRVPTKEMQAILEEQIAAGQIAALTIEDRKETMYYPACDTARLEQIANHQVPTDWQPLETTTEQEVNLLAPLDNVIWDRVRVKSLFDFDYIWEVYKPAAIRRWGYYTMPILYGDRLVARLDPKLDRKSGVLTITGFWLDEPELADDPQFGRALATGLARFARFHQARLEPGAMANWSFARHLVP